METTPRPRHLIIHGHFYQPPRENPWTEQIERQESAAPYHDWNERIANECYLPNALSRRLDDRGRITKLINNYEWISFNFGPTLLSWLEDKFPAAYERLLEADRASAKRLAGHGNAIAQCYNHVIMPLASRGDQETQIRWGVYDFERRFSRESEGIWLPETAINGVTLEVLIQFSFRFILLSPHQALRIRPLDGSSGWKDVSKGSIPPGFPYRCFAPAGRGKRDAARFIDVFFYDAPLSQDVSFSHLLRNGDDLAAAIDLAYPRSGGDLVVAATDGEVYGHHEPFADMALSYLIESAGPRRGLTMTNFGAYLAAHEPRYEVELKPGPNGEGTSWSCFHGVGRWKDDCGDSTGGRPGWNQKWRAPLRAGLGALGETLAALYEKEAAGLFKDPLRARDGYIRVIEERTRDAAMEFVSDQAARELSPAEVARALALLECQRNAQLMFTSCGWFFGDVSGLETVQIMRYAARAIELAGTDQWLPLEKKLLAEFKGAVSNVPGMGTAANIYNGAVKDSIVSRPCFVALYAITSHLSGNGQIERICGNPVRSLGETAQRIAEDHVKIGSLEIVSRITLEAALYEYLLYVEDEASFVCFVRERRSEAEFRDMVERIEKMAKAGLVAEIRPAASEYFDSKRFTIRNFLAEDRERILRRFTANRLEVIEARFAGIFDESKHLLLLLKDANIPVPQNILIPAQTHLTKRLVAEVEQWERSLNPPGLAGIRRIVTQAATFGVPIDTSSAAASFSELILENIKQLADELDAGAAPALEQFVNLADEMGIRTNYRDIQNRLYEILETKISPLLDELSQHPGDREKKKPAIAAFLRLARRFNFNTDAWDKRLEAP
jgi:alpha-amylase/alpha-mannosidase (GH57 family)